MIWMLLTCCSFGDLRVAAILSWDLAFWHCWFGALTPKTVKRPLLPLSDRYDDRDRYKRHHDNVSRSSGEYSPISKRSRSSSDDRGSSRKKSVVRMNWADMSSDTSSPTPTRPKPRRRAREDTPPPPRDRNKHGLTADEFADLWTNFKIMYRQKIFQNCRSEFYLNCQRLCIEWPYRRYLEPLSIARGKMIFFQSWGT